MSAFRKVTDAISVAPQISLEDVAVAKAEGFVLIINNRPDGEEAGQPTSADMAAAAAAAGIAYRYIPISGQPSKAQVEEEKAVLDTAGGPVLAYCRSGNRSIITWSVGQALSQERTPAELSALGRAAGYDLSPIFGA
jgi:uncharacterized protein (TIGR01244 family)